MGKTVAMKISRNSDTSVSRNANAQCFKRWTDLFNWKVKYLRKERLTKRLVAEYIIVIQSTALKRINLENGNFKIMKDNNI
jgi:hypothetical protein